MKPRVILQFLILAYEAPTCKIESFLNICVSPLYLGSTNLLCIILILLDVPSKGTNSPRIWNDKYVTSTYNFLPSMFSPVPPGALLGAVPLVTAAALGRTIGFPVLTVLVVSAFFDSGIVVLAAGVTLSCETGATMATSALACFCIVSAAETVILWVLAVEGSKLVFFWSVVAESFAA